MDANCDIAAEEQKKKKKKGAARDSQEHASTPFDSHFIDLISHP